MLLTPCYHPCVVSALKARVQNGRIVVDEPTDLPEGTELLLVPANGDEDHDPELLHELAASLADEEAGRLVDAEEVMTGLRSRA